MGKAPETTARSPIIHHLNELRTRLFWCIAAIIAASCLGYYWLEGLSRFIQKPLSEKLYYTSPTGGFNFIFLLCLSFGLVIALPIIVYQILAFLKPILPYGTWTIRALLPLCSALLAVVGVAFAYFVSLPAALRFLTRFGSSANIHAMITTDAYFRFALSYLFGFAVLFQLPLIILAIHSFSPLRVRTLMKAQRYVIFGSFLIAAVITPTPDPFNQALMAGPIIALYQLSVLAIWMIVRQKR